MTRARGSVPMASAVNDAPPMGEDTMSPSLKSASNYYAWIADEFTGKLGRNVLDVGGGEGSLLDFVLADGRAVTALDPSSACVSRMRARFADRRFRGVVGDIADESLVRALSQDAFETILCTNVLEHVEDDAGALEHMARILAPTRGSLFLLVPAHPVLFGTPDTLAGHYRRYTRRGLQELLEGAGFRIVSLRHFNSTGFLPYFINSRILRPRTLGGSVDLQLRIYDRWIVPVARRVEKVMRLPFGQSLVAWATPGEPGPAAS